MAMEAAMTSAPPEMREDDAIRAAASLFGVNSNSAKSLGSERDQAFLLLKEGKGIETF